MKSEIKKETQKSFLVFSLILLSTLVISQEVEEVVVSGSFIPDELVKFVEVIPISIAFSFIISEKFDSDPAIPSANATQASFPEAIIIPFKRFSTET